MAQERTGSKPNMTAISEARTQRRKHILTAAVALCGQRTAADFSAVRSAICAIDIVIVAGSPWIQSGMEKDYHRDVDGYHRFGGSANSPKRNYFYRSMPNLVHYLKRAGFYMHRGAQPGPAPGMACFFDWDRGRFNFSPDTSGIVMDVRKGRVTRVMIAQKDVATGQYELMNVIINKGSDFDLALIGYSDLP